MLHLDKYIVFQISMEDKISVMKENSKTTTHLFLLLEKACFHDNKVT